MRTPARFARLALTLAVVVAAAMSLAPSAGAVASRSDNGCTATARFVATSGATVWGRGTASCASVNHIVVKIMMRQKPTQQWWVGAYTSAFLSSANVSMPCLPGYQYRIRVAVYPNVKTLVKQPLGNYVAVWHPSKDPAVVVVTASRWITCVAPIAGD